MVPHIRSHRVPWSCFPKRCPFSCRRNSPQVMSELHSWTGRVPHSTGEVPRLQMFCRQNYWVIVAPHKSKRQLTAECQHQGLWERLAGWRLASRSLAVNCSAQPTPAVEASALSCLSSCSQDLQWLVQTREQKLELDSGGQVDLYI